MAFEMIAYRGRTKDFSLTITDANGSDVVLEEGDIVRVQVGRGSSQIFDLTHEPTEHGSFVSAANPCTIRLAEGDTATLTAGAYDCEVAVLDDSETQPENAIKHAASGVLHVISTLGD